MSPAYLEALRRHQSAILDSVTEDAVETAYRALKYQEWIYATRHRAVVAEEPSINSIGDKDINVFPHTEEL
jgi:hypothetical protein